MCQRGELIDGIVELLKELGINLVLGIVSLTDGTQFVIHIGYRTIVVGHAVHGKHLDDVAESSCVFLLQLLSIGLHLCPCRHHLYHTHLEHGITPLVALTKIVSSVIAATSPTGGMSDIARVSISADTNLMLISTRRGKLVVLVTTDHHHRGAVDHLLEERANSFAVALQVFVGSSMLVGIQTLKVVCTGSSEAKCQQAKHCIFQNIAFHLIFSFHTLESEFN